MIPLFVKKNPYFVGRKIQIKFLRDIFKIKQASLLVIYGKRRVGKTELIEQTFRKQKILKFEGIEGASTQDQIRSFLHQLAHYAQDPLIRDLKYDTWLPVLELLASFVKKGRWIIYFEEIQWLASYSHELIAHLKYIWDNFLRHNPQIILVLCGSSPSFVISKILHSKALYNRSQYELPLKEFSLDEVWSFLGKKKSFREVLEAYLTVGGVPEYLKYLRTGPSVFLSLCQHSFKAGGFFVDEYKRIFTSSLAENPQYQKIISFLAKRRFATREQIATYLKINPGGHLTELLQDLEVCEFIDRYVPYHLPENSLLSRYMIRDQYLQFYYQFIEPIKKRIQRGEFDAEPTKPLKTNSYSIWLGFSFERFCRNHHRLIAKILGFDGIDYQAGPFYNREISQKKPGYQIDLLFNRSDQVITVCEIKFLEKEVGLPVIHEFKNKIAQFPNPKNKTIHKVLIAPGGVLPVVTKASYFDKIIVLKDLKKFC